MAEILTEDKTLSRTLDECWEALRDLYGDTSRLTIEEGKGCPSALMWGEADFQYHFSKICETKFPDKSIHFEVGGLLKKTRVDIVICDKEITWCDINNNGKAVDIAIELAIINIDRKKGEIKSNGKPYKITYIDGELGNNLTKVHKNAKTLIEILKSKKARLAVICLINKVSFANKNDYISCEHEFPNVKILSVHDNEFTKN